MDNIVCVLDVFAENVKESLRREMESAFTVRFAKSYDRDEQLGLAGEADFLVAGWPPVDAEMITRAGKLKAIHKWGIGYDKINLDAAREKGVKLYITAGANAVPVSELALMLMMSVLRRLPFVDANMRNRVWLKSEMRGIAHHLTGKRVGILGMGNIGRNLVKLLRGFDAQVGYYDVFRRTPEEEKAMGITFMPLDRLFSWSQVLSLHTPLTDETRKVVNARTLALMPRDAILVNTARGDLVDEPALIEALRNGVIAGAGLDVFEKEPLGDSPLLQMDNVVLSPHVGGATLNNVDNVARHVRKNLQAFMEGRWEDIPKQDVIVG